MVEPRKKLGSESVVDRPQGGNDARNAGGEKRPRDTDARLAGAAVSAGGSTRRENDQADASKLHGRDLAHVELIAARRHQRAATILIRNDGVADEVDDLRIRRPPLQDVINGRRLRVVDVAAVLRGNGIDFPLFRSERSEVALSRGRT